MMAYQAQPGGMHPGIAPHGHPAMSPGQPMNGSQMQQMGHPGASGPGQPHATQAAAMAGMPPGANPTGAPGMGGQHPGAGQMGGPPGSQSMAGIGPNAHALGHLNPQQFASQQMMQQMGNNPQISPPNMHPNQIAALRRQQQQFRQQQQMQANGMTGMQHGMQGLNPQQIPQLTASNPGMHAQAVPLPQHLQQQQIRLQQQQQQREQQHLAMQHANSQHNNPGGAQSGPSNASGPSNPPSAQPQHQVQMRPHSRMANPSEQTPSNQQQGPHTAQQPGQQPSQQSQQAMQGQPSHAHHAQTQAQAQAQQAQAQAQAQAHAHAQAQAQAAHAQAQAQAQAQAHAQAHAQQQRSQQGGPPQPQQAGPPHPGLAQQQMQTMQHQQAVRQRFQMQQMAQQRVLQARQAYQQHAGGQFILRTMLFADHLSHFTAANGREMQQWHEFVDRHFAPDASLIHTIMSENSPPRTFEILRPSIARYFQTYFESGAQSLRMHCEKSREFGMPHNRHQVSFQTAQMTVSYPNGARLEMNGCVNVLFAPGADVFEILDIHTTTTEEVVSRLQVERVLASWSPKASPKMTKKQLPKAQQKLQPHHEALTIDAFPKTPRGSLGICTRVQGFLEIVESMTPMAELMSYAQERRLRPEQALESFAQQIDQSQSGHGPVNFVPNGLPFGGARPLSMAQAQISGPPPPPSHMPQQMPGHFSSPSTSHVNHTMQNGTAGSPRLPSAGHPPGHANPAALAGGPAGTSSPHQNHMAAPLMVPQHSQHGTNSSVASANTSPSVNNKRRRSTVKIEPDEGGGGGDTGGPLPPGGRVKPSPRMTKKAKPGGA